VRQPLGGHQTAQKPRANAQPSRNCAPLNRISDLSTAARPGWSANRLSAICQMIVLTAPSHTKSGPRGRLPGVPLQNVVRNFVVLSMGEKKRKNADEIAFRLVSSTLKILISVAALSSRSPTVNLAISYPASILSRAWAGGFCPLAIAVYPCCKIADISRPFAAGGLGAASPSAACVPPTP